jgi:SAM-dependent methyltransferase
MIRQARSACAPFGNVRLAQTSGRDLAPFASAWFDLVLAVDVFPYLWQTGNEVVWRNAEDAARVLRPGGTLAIFNFSYRDDLERDRADVARVAESYGFKVVESGVRPFKLWDGAAFLLRKL